MLRADQAKISLIHHISCAMLGNEKHEQFAVIILHVDLLLPPRLLSRKELPHHQTSTRDHGLYTAHCTLSILGILYTCT
jgi:hypothetical protein